MPIFLYHKESTHQDEVRRGGFAEILARIKEEERNRHMKNNHNSRRHDRIERRHKAAMKKHLAAQRA